MQSESNIAPNVRENTPLENFTQRIETLTDRIRESRGTLNTILDRIIGTEELGKSAAGQDRPESAPGEYNSMNYAIDTLCTNVDTLQHTISRMQDRL